MVAPSAADVQGWTKLDELKNADASTASRIVAIAVATFKRFTGLKDALWDNLADEDATLAQHAITGLAEMLTYQSDPDHMETLADFDLLASFNAGPYSETRRSPQEAREARLLVAWPWLSDLLWMMMTPEQYDFWHAFFSDTNAPAWAVQEVDWSAGSDLLGTYDPTWKILDYPYGYG